jgi:transposase
VPRSHQSGKSILAWHRSCEASLRVEEIPGIGLIVAIALVAEIGDWKAFRSGCDLAAWIGLVPKQHSIGGKDRLGSITKQGNRYLRWLLVAGAMANKIARIVWAIMVRGERYKEPKPLLAA